VLLPWKMLGDWLFNFLAEGNLKEDDLHPTAWPDLRDILPTVWTHYRNRAPCR